MQLINKFIKDLKDVLWKPIKIGIEVFLPSVIILIIAFLVIAFYLFPNQNTRDLANYLSGFSTVGLLLLTSFYVIYTNKQIFELQRQTQLQIQPLPYIDIKEGEVCKPELKIDISTGEMCIVLDFLFKSIMKNIGNGVAVSIDAFYEFRGNEIKIGKRSFMAQRLCVLEVGKEISDEDTIRDELFEAINALNKGMVDGCPARTALDLVLRCNVVYRNIIGTPFRLKVDYLVSVEEESKEIISDWLALINSFKTNYAQDIAKYNAVYKRNKDEAFILAKEIINRFAQSFKLDKVALNFLLVPQSFSVRPIGWKEFKSLLINIHHGIPISLGKSA